MTVQTIVRQNLRNGGFSRYIFKFPYCCTPKNSFNTKPSKSKFSTGFVTAANKDKTIIHTEQRILGKNSR